MGPTNKVKSSQFTGVLHFMRLQHKNGEYFLEGIVADPGYKYYKKAVPCKEITEFDGKEVLEVIVSRPLSYPLKDRVPGRLIIELDTVGEIIQVEIT